MNTPAETQDAQAGSHIAALLVQRQNYREKIIALAAKHRYVVFYGCGAILNSIVDTWSEYVRPQNRFLLRHFSREVGQGVLRNPVHLT